MSEVLFFLMVYCFIQALLGRQITRLALWIAVRGKPERESCYRPERYTEGSWRRVV